MSIAIGEGPPRRAHATLTLPAANIRQGRYQNTPDLLRLATSSSCSPYQSWPLYRSPIRLDLIAPFLDSHPDQAFASYIHMGILTGFRIGYAQDRTQLHCRRTNHPSALTNLSVVDERVAAELTAGRLLGPTSPQLTPFVHTSPLGLVPKPHQPNKWRLICDLSSPPDHSVNDGISPDLCSLRYASVQDAVNVIQLLGKGTQLVKLDIKDAYRIVPVHPADYHLLGVAWRGNIYIDRALPFGLRSAPKIFSALADFFA